MKIQKTTALLIRIVGIILLIEIVVVAIIALIGWRAGWQNIKEFKVAIQIAGIFQIGIGFMGIKGNWDATRSFEYQDSRSATSKNSWERTQQNLVDFAQSYVFMLTMFAAGGLSLIIGWLL